jgi:DNA-binding CsgD family transcriptional regulator
MRKISMAEPSLLIDRIYEAGAVQETWSPVLDTLSKKYGCTGGVLFAYGANGSHGWISTPDMRPLLEEFINDRWAEINQKPKRISGLNYPGFINDLDVFSPEEIEADPVYSQFYPSRDLGWAAGTMVPVPSGDTLVFSFERAFRKGPFEDTELIELDALRPHLARAALLSSRLEMRRVHAMTAALELIGLPAAVLRSGGKLYASNISFERFIPAVVRDFRNRLVLVHKGADAIFEDTLFRLASEGASGQSRSIAIPATDNFLPVIAHVIPVCGRAGDIFSQAMALLIFTSVDKQLVPSAEVLQGLFDLTPAEARVARGIVEGKTIEGIALTKDVSRETVRTQVAAVLAKTGLNRQVDLVALLSGRGIAEGVDV